MPRVGKQKKRVVEKKLFFFLALWLDIDLLTIIWCEHVLQRIISLGLIRWKKISFMTYFDWKYYKELLIGNKELGKVQREFTVVVVKIKNVSAFIAEFSPPSLCMSKKKRGIQMLQENYFVMCSQAKRSYNCIAIKWFFPSINYPITSAVVVIILLLPTKKMVFFSDCARVFFLFKYFILGLFIDCFYLICQVLLKIYFFFIPDLNTGFGTLTHISKSWQIFPSGEREKKYLFLCRNLTVILCACILRPPVRRSDFFF